MLDVDPDKGGDDSLSALPDIPVTPRSLTGGGGQHILFRYNPDAPLRNTSGALGPGLDTRADGGYIVAPPSNHISGRCYAWDCDLHPDDVPLADLPAWLIERLTPPQTLATVPASPPPPEAVEGIAARVLEWTLRRVTRQGLGRNEGGLQLAVQLRDNGLTPEQAEPIVMRYQAAVTTLGSHPYEVVEAQASLRQAYLRPARAPWPPSYGVRMGAGPQGIVDAENASGIPAMTDLGNAERFRSDHGDIVRYVYGWATWHIWDGSHWREDTDGEILRLAKQTVRKITTSEVPAVYDSEAQKALAKHALKSESSGRIAAMLELARPERPIALTPAAMDADDHVLNVSNGILDLRTGELYPHDPLLYCSRVAPVAYRSEAQAPLWLAFLARIFDGRQEVIDYLQRAIGYSLTGDTSEQCVFILWGSGANGKSTFLETIKALMADYAQSADPKSFQEQNRDGARSDLARLKGARMVVATESESGARLSESLIKSVTGGEKLVARRLYQDFFEFEPAFKLWLATNHKPHIRNTDHGIRRRIRLIPFAVTIPPEERDKGLRNRLMEELPGILAWAVRGCLAWREGGLREPATVLAATQEYHDEMDRLAPFIEECCEVGPQFSVLSADLFAAYTGWCERTGEKPLSRVLFSLAMQERGMNKIKVGISSSRGFSGVKLNTAYRGGTGFTGHRTSTDASGAYVATAEKFLGKVSETASEPVRPVRCVREASDPLSNSCTHPTFVLRAGERICPSCGMGVA